MFKSNKSKAYTRQVHVLFLYHWVRTTTVKKENTSPTHSPRSTYSMTTARKVTTQITWKNSFQYSNYIKNKHSVLGFQIVYVYVSFHSA